MDAGNPSSGVGTGKAVITRKRRSLESRRAVEVEAMLFVGQRPPKLKMRIVVL
jgi:hypothetical protein